VEATSKPPEIDELRPPSSPAFSLLGISPTEIDRPRTPSALVASIASAVGTSLPSSLALEIAPYWLFDHDDLSKKAFSRSPWRRFASSVSANAATNRVSADAMAGRAEFTDLSAGVHAVPYRAWNPSVCNQAGGPQVVKSGLGAAHDVLRAELARCVADHKAARAVAATLSAAERPAAEAAANQQAAACQNNAAQAFDQTTEATLNRELAQDEKTDAAWAKKLEACEKAFWTPRRFAISAAFASAWRFEQSAWDNAEFLRSALWMTLGWEGKRFSFLLLEKLLWERTGNDGVEPDLLDVGARLIYHRRSWAASVESVRRLAFTSGLDTGFRFAAVGEAKLGSQWITLSIGKDFDSAKDGSFFALANLSLTVGDPQLASPK
jgi:hypothetical protein